MLDYRRFGTSSRRATLFVAVALMTSLSAFGASSAFATTHHPTGEFAPFSDCPLSTAGLSDCVLAETTSGQFTVAKREVPINKTITLTGGFIEEETGLKFVGAEDGNTLSKTALYVPGGLLDIVAPEWLNEKQKKEFNEDINKGITGVTETTELAAPASDIGISTENLLTQTGTALNLPIKIKLGNLFLGGTCYVGSNKAPIHLELTTGKSGSIEGEVGKFEANKAFTLITLNGGKLVNNTFAAPEAEGCGEPLSFLVNKAVDSELGLPSGSGKNEAVLQGKLSTADAQAVIESE
jgi:hypothetical protein